MIRLHNNLGDVVCFLVESDRFEGSYRPKTRRSPETDRASLAANSMAVPRKRRSVASRMSFSKFSVRVHPIGFHCSYFAVWPAKTAHMQLTNYDHSSAVI